MTSKLALGTVQFGLDYGISNDRGQVPFEEVRQILRLADQCGIDTIDTARAYGESEVVLGRALDETMKFRIVTKFPADDGGRSPQALWRESCDRLGNRPIYGYLLHNYHSFRDRLHLVDFLQKLRSQGKVKRTGFSLYHPDELKEILDLGIPFELLQVPFSILDQRFLPYFKELQSQGVEIHARSAFLQGLVFRNPESLPDFFHTCRDTLIRLSRKAMDFQVSIADVCLGFCLAQSDIDRVVIGVDSIENLEQNIATRAIVPNIMENLDEFASFSLDDSTILNPALWETA